MLRCCTVDDSSAAIVHMVTMRGRDPTYRSSAESPGTLPGDQLLSVKGVHPKASICRSFMGGRLEPLAEGGGGGGCVPRLTAIRALGFGSSPHSRPHHQRDGSNHPHGSSRDNSLNESRICGERHTGNLRSDHTHVVLSYDAANATEVLEVTSTGLRPGQLAGLVTTESSLLVCGIHGEGLVQVTGTRLRLVGAGGVLVDERCFAHVDQASAFGPCVALTCGHSLRAFEVHGGELVDVTAAGLDLEAQASCVGLFPLGGAREGSEGMREDEDWEGKDDGLGGMTPWEQMRWCGDAGKRHATALVVGLWGTNQIQIRQWPGTRVIAEAVAHTQPRSVGLVRLERRLWLLVGTSVGEVLAFQCNGVGGAVTRLSPGKCVTVGLSPVTLHLTDAEPCAGTPARVPPLSTDPTLEVAPAAECERQGCVYAQCDASSVVVYMRGGELAAMQMQTPTSSTEGPVQLTPLATRGVPGGGAAVWAARTSKLTLGRMDTDLALRTVSSRVSGSPLQVAYDAGTRTASVLTRTPGRRASWHLRVFHSHSLAELLVHSFPSEETPAAMISVPGLRVGPTEHSHGEDDEDASDGEAACIQERGLFAVASSVHLAQSRSNARAASCEAVQGLLTVYEVVWRRYNEQEDEYSLVNLGARAIDGVCFALAATPGPACVGDENQDDSLLESPHEISTPRCALVFAGCHDGVRVFSVEQRGCGQETRTRSARGAHVLCLEQAAEDISLEVESCLLDQLQNMYPAGNNNDCSASGNSQIRQGHEVDETVAPKPNGDTEERAASTGRLQNQESTNKQGPPHMHLVAEWTSRTASSVYAIAVVRGAVLVSDVCGNLLVLRLHHVGHDITLRLVAKLQLPSLAHAICPVTNSLFVVSLHPSTLMVLQRCEEHEDVFMEVQRQHAEAVFEAFGTQPNTFNAAAMLEQGMPFVDANAPIEPAPGNDLGEIVGAQMPQGPAPPDRPANQNGRTHVNSAADLENQAPEPQLLAACTTLFPITYLCEGRLPRHLMFSKILSESVSYKGSVQDTGVEGASDLIYSASGGQIGVMRCVSDYAQAQALVSLNTALSKAASKRQDGSDGPINQHAMFPSLFRELVHRDPSKESVLVRSQTGKDAAYDAQESNMVMGVVEGNQSIEDQSEVVKVAPVQSLKSQQPKYGDFFLIDGGFLMQLLQLKQDVQRCICSEARQYLLHTGVSTYRNMQEIMEHCIAHDLQY